MKLLLDTHALLWAIDNPKLLSEKVRQAILDESNQLYASVVSVWEIALKVQAGKLELPMDSSFLEENFRRLGIQSYLPLGLFHVQQISKLPPIHKDPFDRILVAQAIVEGWILVSKDQHFAQYPVEILW